jgi:hypothetical protein
MEIPPLTTEELREGHQHMLEAAGNPALMTREVQATLCEHAVGNWRALTIMGAELLDAAMASQARHIDEKLFFELTAQPAARPKPRAGNARASR